MSDEKLLATAQLSGLLVYQHARALTPEEITATARAMEEIRARHPDDEAAFRAAYAAWCKENGL